MKGLYLAFLLIPLLAFAGLSDKAVREINGKSGFIPALEKDDVGLSTAKELILTQVNFAREYTAGETIAIGTLPANSRILNVYVASYDFGADSPSGTFTIGHLAATGYPEDLDAFVDAFFGAPTGGPFSVTGVVYAQKYEVDLPIVMAIAGNTSNWTGDQMVVWIEYLRE